MGFVLVEIFSLAGLWLALFVYIVSNELSSLKWFIFLGASLAFATGILQAWASSEGCARKRSFKLPEPPVWSTERCWICDEPCDDPSHAYLNERLDESDS
mgnify:CR=1 FL=1